MRTYLLLAGLALGMMWAESAQAQSSSSSPSITNIFKLPSSMNITVQPNITNNSPMDYRNANLPIGTTVSSPNTNGTAFPYTLAAMFYQPARTNFIASTTTFGSSLFPTPAQMSAAAPAYLASFQMYRAAPIQPAGR